MNKMELKQKELLEEFNGYVKKIYDNPELGNEEYKTSKLLASILVKYGFETKSPNLLKTDFLGVYDSKKPGPNICYLCEYDALPEIGHGCGHNMIGVTSILAAIMLKEELDGIGGKISVFGCPAEENFGGKVELAKLGAFKDCDVAMMLHPGSKYAVGSRTSALIPVRFTFRGKTSHACNPYNAASALDGAVSTYQGISMLRQFVKPGCFIHGVMTEGGKAANVIPDLAILDYYFRAPTIKYANYIKYKATNIAKSAASMHNLTLEDSIYEAIYEDKKINYTLAKELKKIFKELGIEADDVNEVPGGSSDVGAVSYQIPTIEGNMKICDDNICAHTREFAAKTISEEGKTALKNGSMALAMLGYNLITNKELMESVKYEFEKNI